MSWFKLVMQIWHWRINTHGARSGEQSGWPITGMLYLARNILTDNAVWTGAVSSWSTHDLFFHISGLFFSTELSKDFRVITLVNIFGREIGSHNDFFQYYLHCWRGRTSLVSTIFYTFSAILETRSLTYSLTINIHWCIFLLTNDQFQ